MTIVNQQVVKYIKDSLAQGYNEISIRASLKVNGYPETEINFAFEYLHKTNTQHLKTRVNKKIALFIAGGIIIVIIIGLILFAILGGDKQNQIEKVLKNTNQQNDIILEKNLIVTNNDQKKLEKNIINSKEKLKENNNIIENVPGENIIEKQKYVENLAKTNPQIASTKCNEFNLEYDSNNCYTNLASKLKNPKLCLEIAKNDVKDSCLMNFVRAGKNVCNDLSSEFLKSSCKQLQNKLPELKINIPREIKSCEDLKNTEFYEICINAEIQNSKKTNITFEEALNS